MPREALPLSGTEARFNDLRSDPVVDSWFRYLSGLDEMVVDAHEESVEQTLKEDQLPDAQREQLAKQWAAIQLHAGRTRTKWSAEKLLQHDFPEPRYAVNDLLPEGSMILAGRPKIGKSFIALNIACAVATGGYALDRFPTQQGDVLYCALEDSPRRLQYRLARLLGHGPAPSRLHLWTDLDSLDYGAIAELDEWCDEHPGARLVVIDTLAKVRPQSDSRRSMYELDYNVVDRLTSWARQRGVTVLITHHTRKAAADDPLELVSGTFGLSGGVDGVTVLQRGRGQADAQISVHHRDIEDAEYALRWNRGQLTWTCLEGTAREHQMSKTRREIIQVLEESPDPLRPIDIAAALQANGNTVRQRLFAMSKDGEVARCADGRYSLPGDRSVNDNVEYPVSNEDKGCEHESGPIWHNDNGDNEHHGYADSADNDVNSDVLHRRQCENARNMHNGHNTVRNGLAIGADHTRDGLDKDQRPHQMDASDEGVTAVMGVMDTSISRCRRCSKPTTLEVLAQNEDHCWMCQSPDE